MAMPLFHGVLHILSANSVTDVQRCMHGDEMDCNREACPSLQPAQSLLTASMQARGVLHIRASTSTHCTETNSSN